VTMQEQYENYDKAASMPDFRAFTWVFLLPGIALVVISLIALISGRGKDTPGGARGGRGEAARRGRLTRRRVSSPQAGRGPDVGAVGSSHQLTEQCHAALVAVTVDHGGSRSGSRPAPVGRRRGRPLESDAAHGAVRVMVVGCPAVVRSVVSRWRVLPTWSMSWTYCTVQVPVSAYWGKVISEW